MVLGQGPFCLLVHRFKSGYPVEFGKGKKDMGNQVEEPSTKRSKLVSRVTSLLQPVKTAPLKRIGQTLQRSISFRNEATLSNPGSSSTMTRVSTATVPAAKRRDSKLWSETFDVRLGTMQTLSPKEIKRQEAIFELAQGEQDLVEDLKLAKKAYHDPMLKLSIMTEQELNHIFGTLDSLIPLHEDLLSRLRNARKPDGSTEHVGRILTDWLPCLSSYTSYCSNQVKAKTLLDQKKQDRRVQDFLQRCLQSPFSRKLDLWNFLDIPRSRLVKYPLLLREIVKHTANDHPDRQHLDEAMLMVQSVVGDINRRTGESECQYYKDRLLYTEEGQRDELIDRSRSLSCHGELKNNRGLKLHVFLFQDVLVITRSISLNDYPVSYQLCRQPIPIRQLDLEDLSDGEMRVGGSIRGAFSNNERTKNFFRVSYRAGGQLQSHCFQASDTFNKQQWINCIRQAKEAAALTEDQPPQTGQCVETEPSGQTGLLGEAGLLGGMGLLGETGETGLLGETGETGLLGVTGLLGDTGPSLGQEEENCMWREGETGRSSEGEVGLIGETDPEKEEDVGLSHETLMGMGGGMETGSCLNEGTVLELDGKTMKDVETRLKEMGEMETGQGVGEEMGTGADWRMDGGGEVLSRGPNNVPTFLLSPASPCREEKEREVMEEGCSSTEEGEEVDMDTDLQGEELDLRC
ncbi:Rho guanine nucleotide exchange factor 3 [Dissostichus eleginoides]|uniref:Rho guanine nucleotide exchange factor 3 n=1 Tax=Dissostichus eleginoides TaxID=100907 RepID=A0AAD9FCH0_DISEL|nr:Rho guanine nucleotide exchange factor 3 [Dissostichus eleginoides]